MFWVCLLVLLPTSPSFCVFFPPSCPSFFNSAHTDQTGYDVCTAGLDRAVQETCGLQIPCWHADLNCLFPFQKPGIFTVQGTLRSDSACLTMVENQSQCAASWLTDWFTEWICHSAYCKAQSKILISYHTCTGPTPAHTICYKNSVPLVSLKCYSHASVLWKQ